MNAKLKTLTSNTLLPSHVSFMVTEFSSLFLPCPSPYVSISNKSRQLDDNTRILLCILVQQHYTLIYCLIHHVVGVSYNHMCFTMCMFMVWGRVYCLYKQVQSYLLYNIIHVSSRSCYSYIHTVQCTLITYFCIQLTYSLYTLLYVTSHTH